MTPLESLLNTGTKLWLDSVDPELVQENLKFGATGATSNPVIISDLIKTGRFDQDIVEFAQEGLDEDQIAWKLADRLVKGAQEVFLPIWEKSKGNDGYVSFELDPLLEDVDCPLSLEERISQYIALGKKWSAGHKNRMIKVPATEAGLGAIEELAATGVTLNVTLVFSDRQYIAARDAIWRGAQRRDNLDSFKSVYSIFVSRIDAYTAKKYPDLSDGAQGMVGLLNTKRVWKMNQEFWQEHTTRLQQEIIFASMGVKKPEGPADKYVEALAGSDIQTNPPGTNSAVQESGKTYGAHVADMPSDGVIQEIDHKVDFPQMEADLMEEGLQKFADPQKALLELIRERKATLAS